MALSAGQVHDSDESVIALVLEGVRVPRLGGKGRPRKRPRCVLGDKGYSYRKCRVLLRQHGIACMIPERKDQREQRTKKGRAGGGWPPATTSWRKATRHGPPWQA